ncbi:MAG TPA: C25 family cysteine peptidase [Saprospiraceae bacterium]|nr:C25 family cysteine peptidase [Saprospiraceae bacterium]
MKFIMKYFPVLVLVCLMQFTLTAQMVTGQDTLYGNEWIKPGKEYYKFPVFQDRIYRIPYAVLQAAGVPVNSVQGKNFQLYRMGKEVSIFTTTDSLLSENDYIEFYGQQMRSEIDKFLYNNPEKDLLNPEYSLINDTIYYFLTWENTASVNRLISIPNNINQPGKLIEDVFTTSVFSFPNSRIKAGDADAGIFSSFDTGEGYGTGVSKTFSAPLTIQSVSPNEDSISIHIRVYGGIGDHNLSLYLNDQLFANKFFKALSILDTTFQVPVGLLAASNTIKINDDGASLKGFSVATVQIGYQRSLIYSGFTQNRFEIPASADTSYLEIQGFFQGGGSPLLYNMTKAYRMTGEVSNGITRFNLPPSSKTQDILLHSGATPLAVTALTKIVFKDYSKLNADFVIISHPALYDDGNGNNFVQQYADYRASDAGGNHSVVIVDIQDLYDQFAYGNVRHFISMRNFAHFIKKNWSAAKSLFIIGKGREYAYFRQAGHLTNPSNSSFYVPTFGTPGSDNLLVMSQGEYSPVLALGRIAAQTPQDIADYLKKIQDYESFGNNQQTIADQLWKKEIIHLGGGKNKNEQNSFRNLLESVVPVITNNRFGGRVHGFYKTSTDPIQVSQNEQIFDLINNGVSIITFLGHSAVGTFDFSIDNPSNYQNFGKYPLMFSLGCYSGNYHTPSRGTGEGFCFYKEKGALGFVATSFSGYPSVLTQFAGEFYRQQGGDSYGQSVGEVLQHSYSELAKNATAYTKLLIEQMSYHGDPAYTIHTAPGPDFTPDISTLKIEPAIVTAQTDSLSISFDVANIGEYIEDSINITLRQKLPAGEIRTLADFGIKTPSFRTPIHVKVPSFKAEAFGQNILYIDVDTDNKVVELPSPLAEQNNSLSQNGETGFMFFVTDNSAIPVSPPNYSIVSNEDFELIACTADPLAKEKPYLIQIDTTRLFNSPRLASNTIATKGGLIEWVPGINMLDSVTYYWRITPDSTQTGVGAIWQYSSFFYKENSPKGWSIAHNFQFNEGNLVNIKPVASDQKMYFITDIKDVFIQNFKRQGELYPAYYINNGLTEINYGNDIAAGVYVGVIDPLTGTAWINPKGGKYGSVTPIDWRERKAFPFPTADPAKRASLISFLKDTIPSGYFVVFFTVQDAKNSYKPEDWAADSITLGTNIFQLLEAQGAKSIRNTANNAVPYSFGYQKDVKPLGEAIGKDIDDVASLNFGLEGSWDRGSVTTPLAGPAKSWTKLTADIEENTADGDYSDLAVYGLDKSKQNKQLLLDLKSAKSADLSSIDASQYPYLQVVVNLKDTLFKTAPYVRYIRLYYSGVTELALNSANADYSFHKDTIDQGDILKLNMPVQNISGVGSDSVLVKYVLTAADLSQQVELKKQPAIGAGEKMTFPFQRNTIDLKGDYKLDIEINPGPEQLETYYFNNQASLRFTVLPDRRNPLLNVLFDGIHILDGDIVSPKPEITIELKDENKYISLTDTSSFKLFLRYPGKSVFDAIPISSSEVSFIPAKGTGKSNIAKAIYKPAELKDGEYELLVQAKDASNNASGQSDFKIRFRVINQKSVSGFLPCPNPFSTAMGFVYTLTGDRTPEHVRIRIYSVSGSLVKEITEQELGILRVGTHVTDYKWDGTDMYGNKLANGVYLYQVVIKDDAGKQWDSYTSKADDFLQHGFGKLVILR